MSDGDYIEIDQDLDAQWRWRMKAANHEIIAVSGEGYTDFGHTVSMAHRVGKGIPVYHEGKRLGEDGSILYVKGEDVPEVVDEDGAPLE